MRSFETSNASSDEIASTWSLRVRYRLDSVRDSTEDALLERLESLCFRLRLPRCVRLRLRRWYFFREVLRGLLETDTDEVDEARRDEARRVLVWRLFETDEAACDEERLSTTTGEM